MRMTSCSGCDRRFAIPDEVRPRKVRSRKKLEPRCAILAVYSLMAYWGPTKSRMPTHPTYRQRAMHFGVEYEPGITLSKVLARHGPECRLCGEPVHDTAPWGTHNPRGPSIDHIVPLSKGGGHVWGNVQVAHHGCNTRKGRGVST